MDLDENPWNSMDFHENPWNSMDFHGLMALSQLGS